MSPALVQGDAIVITRPPASLEPGMVVTLEVDDRVVTHRVINVDSQSELVTRGDANAVPDDWGGNRTRVVGVQRIRIPLLGSLLAKMASVRTSGAWWVNTAGISVEARGSPCFEPCAVDQADTLAGRKDPDETAACAPEDVDVAESHHPSAPSGQLLEDGSAEEHAGSAEQRC